MRALDDNGTTLCKIKTPYYLTTKFLSRMKDGNWKHLYANPESFKEKIDEEFFPLVDRLKADVRLEDVLALDETARRDLVADLVCDMLEQVSSSDRASGLSRLRQGIMAKLNG